MTTRAPLSDKISAATLRAAIEHLKHVSPKFQIFPADTLTRQVYIALVKTGILVHGPEPDCFRVVNKFKRI